MNLTGHFADELKPTRFAAFLFLLPLLSRLPRRRRRRPHRMGR